MGDALARITSRLLRFLRNHSLEAYSREEFRFAHISFSQFGEDLAVERWVERLEVSAKTYVDVGCFHPIHHSNTLLLSKNGWRGVNIDFDAEKIQLFERLRPRDFNVTAAVSSCEGEKQVFRYESGGTNRLGEAGDPDVRSAIGELPVSTGAARTRTLDSILSTAPWPIAQIGYLNIDCEGHDLEVLKGLDLARFRPAIISIEALKIEEVAEVGSFLCAHGYSHRETIFRTLLFTLG